MPCGFRDVTEWTKMPQAKYSSNLAGFNVIPIVISLDPVDDKFFFDIIVMVVPAKSESKAKTKNNYKRP